jgi:hypothetical protein
MPDLELRIQILTSFIDRVEGVLQKPSATAIRRVAESTDEFSPAELAQLVVDAICEGASSPEQLIAAMLQNARSRVRA